MERKLDIYNFHIDGPKIAADISAVHSPIFQTSLHPILKCPLLLICKEGLEEFYNFKIFGGRTWAGLCSWFAPGFRPGKAESYEAITRYPLKRQDHHARGSVPVCTAVKTAEERKMAAGSGLLFHMGHLYLKGFLSNMHDCEDQSSGMRLLGEIPSHLRPCTNLVPGSWCAASSPIQCADSRSHSYTPFLAQALTPIPRLTCTVGKRTDIRLQSFHLRGSRAYRWLSLSIVWQTCIHTQEKTYVACSLEELARIPGCCMMVCV